MLDFAKTRYTVDRDATIAAYARAQAGCADTCECAGCRNFRLARATIFPQPFLALLDRFGIDPRKDGEVYHLGPVGTGRHAYGGWYHFVGTLGETSEEEAVDFGDGFTAWLCLASAPRLASFEELQVVQLEISVDCVPWLLDDAELD
jgi:hypothetical protein